MGQKHLIDTNVVIDFFNGKLPESGKKFLSGIEPIISVITQIELFSSNQISEEEIKKLSQFMDIAVIYPLNSTVAIKAADLRKHYRIKLPDAVIAATALAYDLSLVTRNVSDFKKLEGLKILNPHDSKPKISTL